MLDDELIVEEHFSIVYIKKNAIKSPCTGQSNVISAELGTLANLHYHLQFKW
jgi:hypothetical protein